MRTISWKIAFPILILTVFLAGCTLPTGKGGSKVSGLGVVVREFKVDPSSIEAINNQNVYLSLTLQNNGENEASNPQAIIFGLPNEFAVSNLDLQPKTLKPASPERGIPEGETSFGQAVITYNGGDKSTSLTYNFVVRVNYAYSTVVEGSIKAVTTQYFRQTNDRGGLQMVKYTSGPLKVDVVVPSSVIGQGSSVRVYLYISNVGGGRTYTDNIDNKLDFVKIVPLSGVNSCPVNEIRIPLGSSALVSCDLGSIDTQQGFTTKTFRIKIDYNYYFDIPSAITVLPTLK